MSYEYEVDQRRGCSHPAGDQPGAPIAVPAGANRRRNCRRPRVIRRAHRYREERRGRRPRDRDIRRMRLHDGLWRRRAGLHAANHRTLCSTKTTGCPCRPRYESRAQEASAGYRSPPAAARTVARRTSGASTGVTSRPPTPGRSAAFSPARTDDNCPLSASGFATKRTAISSLISRRNCFIVGPSDDDDVGDAALE